MGFSASGAVALFGVALLIALSTYYGAASNTMERLTAAEAAQVDHHDAVQEVGINITSVDLLDDVTCDVRVLANNTGERLLDLNDTDLLYNNTYQTDWQSDAKVEGDQATELWLPGEQLNITDTNLASVPSRIKLVSDPGVADTTEVSGLSC